MAARLMSHQSAAQEAPFSPERLHRSLAEIDLAAARQLILQQYPPTHPFYQRHRDANPTTPFVDLIADLLMTGYPGDRATQIADALRGSALHKPVRSKYYRAYVRRQPCAICGERYRVQAHHLLGSSGSLKSSDLFLVPLCAGPGTADHHGMYENRAPDLLRALVTTLVQFVADTLAAENQLDEPSLKHMPRRC